MLSHKLRSIVFAMTALSLAAGASMHANTTTRRTYLTFDQPFGLPGVTLKAGTYVFELADPDGASDVVRVRSRDGKIVYLMASTYLVSRPAEMPPTQLVSFNEAARDSVAPITVWWSDDFAGRQFIYPNP
jgi:hypothetical protein